MLEEGKGFVVQDIDAFVEGLEQCLKEEPKQPAAQIYRGDKAAVLKKIKERYAIK